MSEHGRRALREPNATPDLINPNAVSWHEGTAEDFLDRHQRHCNLVLRRGREGLLEIAPRLLHRISDDRTLSLAFDHLAEHGGQAPGPDGLCYSDFDEPAKWKECRRLRDEIRAGEYSPGEEYLRWIPKRSGKGMRPLILQGIWDRTVQRGTVEILRPLLDPRFDSRSFGFRPKRGTLDALARAERLALDGGRWAWVSVDIRDAFCHVSVPRLMDILRMNLVDEELMAFLERVLSGAKLKGLRQGGPLSPLLLNVYLDHFLDRKWRKLFPTVPMIRFADDILLLCKTAKKALAAYAGLVKLLSPAGMTLKEGTEEAVCRLDLGATVRYLGFEVGKGDGRLRIGLADSVWSDLTESLEDAHEAPASALRAFQCVCGWLHQRAASFPDLGVDAVYGRVQKAARQLGFEELLYPGEVVELAQDAVRRWEDVRIDALCPESKMPAVAAAG